jgi:hypothetical protein
MSETTAQTETAATPVLSNALFGQTAERMVHSVVASQPVSKMTFTPHGLEISFIQIPKELQDKIAVPGVQFPPEASQKALDQYRAMNEAGLTMGVDQMQAVANKLKQQHEAATVASTATDMAPRPENAIVVPPEAAAAAAQAVASVPAQQQVQTTAGEVVQPVVGKYTAALASQAPQGAVRGL